MKNGEIISNLRLKGAYFEARFYAPEIASAARTGQFVQVRIDERYDHILRRPFSIHKTTPDGVLAIVYKVVGAGTELLSKLRAGDCCDLLGPLGNGYTPYTPGTIPVLVCGGFGSAATYMIAREAGKNCVLLFGARTAADVLLDDRYRDCGCDVRIATDDGSAGSRGLVTGLIPGVLRDYAGKNLFFQGCGPGPMLTALAKLLNAEQLRGEVSLDHMMCCGVGACFSCVVKIKADNEQGWAYRRSCVEGPVFPADTVWTEA